MPVALSTAWNSARHRDGEAMLQEAAELGFAAVELSHGIPFSLCPGILAAVAKKTVAVSSVHNFCPLPLGVYGDAPNCYQFSDPREAIRRAAIRHSLETFDFAVKVGAPAVVLHLGWAGPKGVTARLEKAWQQGALYARPNVRARVDAVVGRRRGFDALYGRVRACLDELVPAAKERGLRLGFENRADYAEFPDEVEMDRLLADYPPEVAGYWHDFGHGARTALLGWHDHRATLVRRQPRWIGAHIHDFVPPKRDHRPVGAGTIDFPALVPLLPRDAIQVLELSPRVPREDVIKSRQTWHSFVNASA